MTVITREFVTPKSTKSYRKPQFFRGHPEGIKGWIPSGPDLTCSSVYNAPQQPAVIQQADARQK